MHGWCDFHAGESAAIAVCGAGAAGIATAISAARNGAGVLLIEQRPEIGGTVTHTLIHTLAGLYDSEGRLLNGGLAQELVARLQHDDRSVHRRKIGRTYVLNCRPQSYARVVADWISETRGIDLCCGANIDNIHASGGRVHSIEVTSHEGTLQLDVQHLIDATGAAEIVRRLDPSLVEDASHPCAGGLIFSVRGVAPEVLCFPNSLRVLRQLRDHAKNNGLPTECEQTWLDSGNAPDEAYVKLMVPMRSDWRRRFDALDRQAKRNANWIWKWLQRIEGFGRAEIDCIGELGVRDGGRIRGEYCLTASDVRAGRQFSDAACRCAWPIEFWDSDRGVSLEYLSAPYEIPLRCLKLRGWQNVWSVGKCLSADRDAHASARGVGTCWAMGDALGKACTEMTRVAYVESR